MLSYAKINNTYISKIDSNPMNTIDIEIGDSKQPVFMPQLKLMRWDNEVNLSLRLITDVEQVETEKDGIISTNNIRFYDTGKAYEFEITLKEKPSSNVISFTMQTKGVRFEPQPTELTQWEKNHNCFRPENVKGSYAIYTAEHKLTIAGGKEYGTNIVGHIFRPELVDAVGTKVWGVLNIDVKAGLLTVTIPQKFLDKAVYPITHAAGLTVGYETAGTSTLGVAANRWYAGYLTSDLITGNFKVSKLTASVLAGAVNYKGFIVDHDDQTIMADGISGAVADSANWSQHWQNITYATNPVFLSGYPYDIGLICDGSVNFYYNVVGGYYVIFDTSNNYSSPTDPTDRDYGLGYHVSIYATYTSLVTGQFMTTNRGYW
jgi:hypothetical protein